MMDGRCTGSGSSDGGGRKSTADTRARVQRGSGQAAQAATLFRFAVPRAPTACAQALMSPHGGSAGLLVPRTRTRGELLQSVAGCVAQKQAQLYTCWRPITKQHARDAPSRSVDDVQPLHRGSHLGDDLANQKPLAARPCTGETRELPGNYGGTTLHPRDGLTGPSVVRFKREQRSSSIEQRSSSTHIIMYHLPNVARSGVSKRSLNSLYYHAEVHRANDVHHLR